MGSHAVTASLCFLASLILCASLDAPLWSTDIAYEATGTIEMPYSEIVEPFRAYYDGKNRRSLQVYYGTAKERRIATRTSLSLRF